MQKFSSDYSIINSVHSLAVIPPGKGEEFDFSVSNDVAGVQISNSLDILEIISYFRSDPFTLIYLDLLVNSNMIACTHTQNFEKGENCASTISMEDTLGYDLFSDMIIFDPGFNIQEVSVFLVTGFMSFDMTNQAPQVSLNFVVEDSMLVLSYEFFLY